MSVPDSLMGTIVPMVILNPGQDGVNIPAEADGSISLPDGDVDRPHWHRNEPKLPLSQC